MTTQIIDLDQIHGNQPYEFAKSLFFNKENELKTTKYNRITIIKNNEQIQEERTGESTKCGNI